MKTIKNLRTNKYHKRFFEIIIERSIHQCYDASRNKERKYMSLPYNKSTSKRINKVSSKHDVDVAHKLNNAIKKLFSK